MKELHQQEALAAQERAAREVNRQATLARNEADREALLDAHWEYKAAAVNRQARWERLSREEEEAMKEELDRIQRWRNAREQRDRESREEVLKRAWERRAVAAEQNDIWQRHCTREEEMSPLLQPLPQREEESTDGGLPTTVFETKKQKMRIQFEQDAIDRHRKSAMCRQQQVCDEMLLDSDHRKAVCCAQKARCLLATDRSSEGGSEQQLRAQKEQNMYREREAVKSDEGSQWDARVQAYENEESALSMKRARAAQALEAERAQLHQELQMEAMAKRQKEMQTNELEAAEERATALEQWESMKQRAIEKALQVTANLRGS